MFKKKKAVNEPENYEKAYDYAVFLLSLRLRTTGEVSEKMSARGGSASGGQGYNPEVVENVIKQLIDQKYLDDERFAQIFLDNLKKYKNFGFYGIKKKMMEKRLPPEIIENVLSEGLPIEEEMKIAERLLKKEKSLPLVGRVGEGVIHRQKLAAKLKSKGFRSDVIVKLIFG